MVSSRYHDGMTGLPEFATWKIRHTTGETHECDGEFERKRRTNVCNSADVEDSPHDGDRLRSEGWVGVGCGVEVGGGWGQGSWGRGVGSYVSPAVWRIFHVANPLATA